VAAVHLTLILVAVIIAALAGLVLALMLLVKQWKKKGGTLPFVRMTVELGNSSAPTVSPPRKKESIAQRSEKKAS
jgi:hypothetical protein